MNDAKQHMQAGRWRDALSTLEQSNVIDDQVTYLMGLCHANLQQFRQASELFEKCREHRPADTQLMSDLGNCYRLMGESQKAMSILFKAHSLAPNHPGIAVNLGLCKLASGDARGAIALLEPASRQHKGALALLDPLCEAYIKSKRLALGEPLLSKIRAHLPAPRRYELSALIQLQKGDTENAIDCLEKGLNEQFSEPLAMQLGVLLEELNFSASAADRFIQVIQHSHDNPDAWFRLSHLRDYQMDDTQVSQLKLMVDKPSPKMSIKSIAKCSLALAKHYGKKSALTDEINYLKEAHLLLSKVEDFDSTSFTRTIQHLLQLTASTAIDSPSSGPIFVLGNPRSGTTLIDQILACHTDTHATGESTLIADIASEIKYRPGLTISNIQKERALTIWRSNYSETSSRVVDTTPDNLFFIDLINQLFDDAKIVAVRRRLDDTALSIYQQGLSSAHAYAHDVDTLALRVTAVDNMLEKLASDNQVIAVNYEQLVSDSAQQISKLLSRLSLSDDKACYEPNKLNRRVSTPSAAQVKQPISTKAIGRSEQYRKVFEELFSALEKAKAEIH